MKYIGEAFAYPFRDPDWISKFLVGGLMVLLSVVLIGVFFLLGYSVRITQRVMRREPNALPDWSDLGGLFVLGFKYAILYLVYALPIIAIVLLIVFFGILVAATNGDEAAVSAMFVFYVMLFIVIVPYAIALTILTPVITVRFAQREQIRDGLALGEIFRFFKKNWANTLIVALLLVGLESLEGIGILVFIIGFLFTTFYSSLVSYHLMGQLNLESIEPKESP